MKLPDRNVVEAEINWALFLAEVHVKYTISYLKGAIKKWLKRN